MKGLHIADILIQNHLPQVQYLSDLNPPIRITINDVEVLLFIYTLIKSSLFII